MFSIHSFAEAPFSALASQDVIDTVTLSSVSATANIGSVFAFPIPASTSLSSISATANIGTITKTLTGVLTPTAVASTGVIGTLKPNVSFPIAAGVSATGNVAGLEQVGVGAGAVSVVGTGVIANVAISATHELSSASSTISVGTPKVNLRNVLSSLSASTAIGTLIASGVIFDFEAIKEEYSRDRVVYVDKVTVSTQNRTVHVMQENRKVYVERFSTSAERRARAA